MSALLVSVAHRSLRDFLTLAILQATANHPAPRQEPDDQLGSDQVKFTHFAVQVPRSAE